MRVSRPEPRIWMSMAAIALCFSVPLVVTTWYFVGEKQLSIDFANQELRGDAYLRPASRLLVHVELHRSALLSEDPGQVKRVEALIDDDLRALLAVDDDLSDELTTTNAALSERGRGSAAPRRLQASWESVKLADSGALSAEVHERLILNIRALILHIGDSSNLILDPDLDTYYLMDALLLKEPEIIDRLTALDVASTAGANEAALAVPAALLRAQIDGLVIDLDTAFAETPRFNESDELEPTLRPLLTQAVDATERVLDLS
ncbi:MAG: hypothetical protein ABIY48_13425, partial [Acidimicrobiales bacterium]